MGAEVEQRPLPVLIRLSELTSFIQDPRFQARLAVDDPTLLPEFVSHWAGAKRTGIPAQGLEAMLSAGRAVLLLDGLDEIPSRALIAPRLRNPATRSLSGSGSVPVMKSNPTTCRGWP